MIESAKQTCWNMQKVANIEWGSGFKKTIVDPL